LGQECAACGNLDASALGHRVTRIDHQVHDDLPHLPFIPFDRAQVRRETGLQINMFANQGAQQLFHVPDDGIQV